MSIGGGSRVLVVGGSSGIGLATAAMAAKEGAAVTIAARSPARLATAAETFPSAGMAVLDMTDARAVEAFFAKYEDWNHVVVAGSATDVGPVRGLSLEAARAAMESKFWGAYHVGRYARIAGGGSLTFVSGVYSVRPSNRAVLQGAINAALEGLARGLALELAPVRVNTVSPGLTATPLWDRLEASVRETMYREKAAALPVGRIGQPEDIARAIIFLAASPFTTGTTLLVDGGDALV
jgi:NAD(P)-dependent dehydrogenase (short-subunit alcohol dehydrogenase family)